MRRAGLCAALALLLCAGACRSRMIRHTRSATDGLGDDLVAQLERRTDTRRLRLLVRDFECTHGPAVHAHPGHRASWEDGPELPERFRNQLVAALAQRVHVVEGPQALACFPPPEPCVDARDAGANAVLVGNYTVVGRRELLVQTRVLDADNGVVLAAAERTVRR